MRTGYFDCFAGASGDMLLGALIDAGVSVEDLEDALKGVPFDGYHLETVRVQRGPIAATKANVVIDADEDDLPERRLIDILDLLNGSDLPDPVVEQAGRVFRALAEAEAEVHGAEPEEIHFHEVGAIDAIVDITGTLTALYLLELDAVYASPLPPGGGTIWSSHGRLPVPAPATAALMARAGAPFGPNPVEPCPYELVTPTGAAILTTIATFERPSVFLERIGYGAGGQNPTEFPNVLRLWVGDSIMPVTEPLVLLETNLDNVAAEVLGYTFDRLFAAGAFDVWFTSIQMKKNRPGTLVSAIGPAHLENALADILIRETRTLGVRVRPFRRHEADRRIVVLDSPLGTAEVKLKIVGGRIVEVNPEYESARTIAERLELPLTYVYDQLRAQAENEWPYGSSVSDD